MTVGAAPAYERERVSAVGERAVVVGASMAGLFATRVVADGFEEVVLVERDPLPDAPVARRGVPQATHVHVLLEAGRATIEDLFPGYSRELLSAGGMRIDAATQISHYAEGGFLADSAEPIPMYFASRPLLEQLVRRRVTAMDDVTVRDGCRYTGFLTDGDTNVTGVTVRDGDGDEAALEADLVVDATGRTSATPAWLERVGYDSPAVDEVRVDVAYGTALVERPEGDQRGFLVPPANPRTRGAAAVPIEDGRWQVTLIGVHGDDPPTDIDGFRAYAGSLPVPELARLLDDHPLASDTIRRYPFPANLRRHYETLDRFPEGLVVVGDGIASFNPIYGQGMSVAALESLHLHGALAAGGRDDLAPRLFDRTEPLLDLVWRMAVGTDFEFPETTGPKPLGTGLFNRYVSRLTRRAHTDGVLAREFYRVLRLEQSPLSLFRPSVLRRVFLAGR